jgi:GNAT superfamily N-acetyltransferase
VQRVSFPQEAAIIDRVAPSETLGDAIATLTCCGLGEAGLWLRPFEVLSEGEKFRARLARAVALHARGDCAAPLLCDEFCAVLHRRAAKAISFNLHKLVARRNLCAVLACAQDDIVADLRPHVVARLAGRGRCELEERAARLSRRGRPGDAHVVTGAEAESPRGLKPAARKTISFLRRLRIEQGSRRDYDAFAAMHYRAGDELGFVDKVFVLRERDGEALGVVVYSHAPLELALRNRATDGWFSRRPHRVNRHLRIIRRLVIHPDVRGCGLGHYLVRKTMPLVGTQYVECLAGMGEFNPVFERAGMQRIAQYEPSAARRVALDELRRMGLSPWARDFVLHVARRRVVRRIVARVVADWYAGTTGGGEARVARQSPQFLAQTFRGLVGSRPVYYLWKRDENRTVTDRKRS